MQNSTLYYNGHTLWVRRHSRHGRGFTAGSMLFRLDGQLRVGGMAEAHQAEAARVGGGFLYRRRGGFVVVMVDIQRGARRVGGGGPAAIFGHGDAVYAQVFARLVEARVFVAALEESGRIEGAAALEVSVASVRSESPQRHCWARG
jgi:hypothetical protein